MNFTSDIVIGLEIHVELDTNTKLFCGCSRKAKDNEEPNTRICPICLGHPGSKPSLNKEAINHALKIALATNSEIAPELVFSRKSYFYPDLAKNFQISQFELPLAQSGNIELENKKKINLTRIHLEEDPAALIHPNGIGKYVLIDYNRSGNPLVEIVTEPELESPAEARDFMKQLLTLLKYLKIFDIQSCVIKADVNISIKESGYTRAEIKNVTGFKEIERAIYYEVERQKQAVNEGQTLIQETRGWNPVNGITKSLRKKETNEDYGYIIEPDLVITNITNEKVKKISESMPELPKDKEAKYISQHELDKTDAKIISSNYELANLFEDIIEKVSAQLTARWLRRELIRVMNYNKIDFPELRITSKELKILLSLVQEKKITETVGQKILEKLAEKSFDIEAYIKENGLEAVSDSGQLETYCKEAVQNSPDAVKDYKNGNEKALNYVVGQVMKKTKGAASPHEVKEVLTKILDS
ncbi:MAG: Asp-tRNA(Asn)/Glu-tRNA(Gln) amidotransferase subunit GatB [Nanobdellota archaeon]